MLSCISSYLRMHKLYFYCRFTEFSIKLSALELFIFHQFVIVILKTYPEENLLDSSQNSHAEHHNDFLDINRSIFLLHIYSSEPFSHVCLIPLSRGLQHLLNITLRFSINRLWAKRKFYY